MQNIYEKFDEIFSQPPQPPKSIFLQLDVLSPDSNSNIIDTNLDDIYEFLLNMFIYGFKKLNLDFNFESMNIIKKYFESIGIKISVELEDFDTILFKDPRYIYRYCTISDVSFKEESPFFFMNTNKINRSKLKEYIGVFQLDYLYLCFISFDYF